MDSKYIHKDFEDKIYKQWEKSGGFAPNDDPKAKPFCIIMPPPNANDPLHVGHAMFVTIEDIMIRYHRMKGDASLWLPGTDHAGIETQFVFEKKLKKDGKSRFDFDRETLYQMIWDYVQENSGVAVAQMKKLGASADWGRFKFTLDSDVVEMVLDTFIKLNEDGLIYRGERLVNYCTACGTGYSELEVEHEERNSPLYYIKYGPFTLATVRPETKFGDTAVAVNPKDKRYRKWIGKEIDVEGLNGSFRLSVVGDLAVDPEFGTGVVKVTPAHDFTDFEISQRHNLPLKQVIGFDGRLTDLAGKYAGMKVEEARKVVVEDMKQKGLIEKVDEHYTNRVATCYRCHRTIEPLPLKQFFVKVKPLAQKALAALDCGETIVLGAGREKILRHWLTNLKDWNISRQIVWGIRLPIWYKGEDKEKWVASKTSPGKGYVQETDTFDTWFSSGQWPVVTLKASRRNGTGKTKSTQEEQDDFERFYPTQVMETAYEILPFWVMRMMMLGIYLTGKSPFKYVYLHGLIRDEKGRKMSKSVGNVINPLTIVDQYGADALRMALVIRSTPGLDKGVGDGDFRAARNLTNKIWNSARYVLMSQQNSKTHPPAGGLKNSRQTRSKDEKFYKHLDEVTKIVTKQLDDLRVGLAAETLYNEFWHWFCNEVIEKNKNKEVSDRALLDGLVTFLKLLHPFVPFVTEAVWEELKAKDLISKTEKLLMVAGWPTLETKV